MEIKVNEISAHHMHIFLSDTQFTNLFRYAIRKTARKVWWTQVLYSIFTLLLAVGAELAGASPDTPTPPPPPHPGGGDRWASISDSRGARCACLVGGVLVGGVGGGGELRLTGYTRRPAAWLVEHTGQRWPVICEYYDYYVSLDHQWD